MTKYEDVEFGDAIILENGDRLDLECCDCGLVHRIEARIDGQKVALLVKGNKRATTWARRRRMKLITGVAP